LEQAESTTSIVAPDAQTTVRPELPGARPKSRRERSCFRCWRSLVPRRFQCGRSNRDTSVGDSGIQADATGSVTKDCWRPLSSVRRRRLSGYFRKRCLMESLAHNQAFVDGNKRLLFAKASMLPSQGLFFESSRLKQTLFLTAPPARKKAVLNRTVGNGLPASVKPPTT